MKRALAALAAFATIVGAVVVGLVLYATHVVRSLDTPEFKARAVKEASAAVGAQVHIEKLRVSLLRGIRLTGIRVANPPGFVGELLTADTAALSYRPWSLLRGRIELDEIRLAKPVVTLASNARGAFNYEKLVTAKTAATGAAGPGPVAATSTSAFPRLLISRLAVEGARIGVVDDKNVASFRLDDADLEASLGVVAGVVEGTGRARVASVSLADALFLRDVSAPLKLTPDRMSLAPLRAKLAGGEVTGEIQVKLKPAMRYSLRFEASGAKVSTLLKEARSASSLTGTLKAKAAFEGTGGLPTVKGDGRAEIKDCRWPKSPLLGVLAALLQLPELADPRFDECRAEFTVASGQARTPVVSLKGPAVQLTGQGVMSLASSTLDYDMTLALAPALLGKIPSGTVRAAFHTRPDGFGAIDFAVTGTTAAPKTDLASRFGRSVAIEAAKGGLGRLFGRKKPK